jgi:hypothetical protein
MAFEQSYGKQIEFLAFTHLRENVKKFHQLPINEEMALDLLNEYLGQESNYED